MPVFGSGTGVLALTYATLAELKGWLSITDNADDSRLELALSAATAGVDEYCHRSFSTAAAATARAFRPYRDGTLWTDDVSSTTDLVVKTDDDADGTYETTWAAADYTAEPVNALATGRPLTHFLPVSKSFPSSGSRARVQVTARWGWPSTPHQVKQATLMLASRYYKRKESPEGVLGNSEFGVIRVSRQRDADVVELLDPFALMAVA